MVKQPLVAEHTDHGGEGAASDQHGNGHDQGDHQVAEPARHHARQDGVSRRKERGGKKRLQ